MKQAAAIILLLAAGQIAAAQGGSICLGLIRQGNKDILCKAWSEETGAEIFTHTYTGANGGTTDEYISAEQYLKLLPEYTKEINRHTEWLKGRLRAQQKKQDHAN